MKKTNNARRFHGPGPRPDHRAHRQQEAIERQAAYDKLSNVEKLAMLDRKFGEGKGAAKQRARIAKTIEDASKPKASPKTKDAKTEIKA